MTTVAAPQGMVVFGDSVAEGREDPDPAGGWLGWAVRLAGLLDIPRELLFNAAEPGATVAEVARKQLLGVRRLAPRLVVLNCGMNDVLHGYERTELTRALEEVFDWARGAGAIAVTASIPVPPLLERSILSEFRKKRTRQRIREFNEELRRCAHEFSVEFLGQDLLPGVHDKSMWSSDGIHLNSAGHAYVANVIKQITGVREQSACSTG